MWKLHVACFLYEELAEAASFLEKRAQSKVQATGQTIKAASQALYLWWGTVTCLTQHDATHHFVIFLLESASLVNSFLKFMSCEDV